MMTTEMRKVGRRMKDSLRRGQAMAEYSSILFVLATAGGVTIITVLPTLMNALNRYLQGIYYMLNMAVP